MLSIISPFSLYYEFMLLMYNEYNLLASPQKGKTRKRKGENSTVQFKVKMLDSSFDLASLLKASSSQYCDHCSLPGNTLLRVLLGLVLL